MDDDEDENDGDAEEQEKTYCSDRFFVVVGNEYYEKMYGSVSNLIKIPEIRKILVEGRKLNTEREWIGIALSGKTKLLLKKMHVAHEDSKMKSDLELALDKKLESFRRGRTPPSI